MASAQENYDDQPMNNNNDGDQIEEEPYEEVDDDGWGDEEEQLSDGWEHDDEIEMPKPPKLGKKQSSVGDGFNGKAYRSYTSA